MATHSKLGASSAYRWFICPGSVRLAEMVPPSKSSPDADLGTAAHMLGEACLLKNKNAAEYIGQVFNEKFEITEHIAESIQLYIDAVRGVTLRGSDMGVEEPFHLDWLHPDLFGTNDAFVARHFDELFVFDYKNGYKFVDVEWNPQLLYYALGAAKRYEFDFSKITLIVVQPNAPSSDGPVRAWSLTPEELEQWAYEVLLPKAKATEDPNAPLVAGNHCYYCPAAAMDPTTGKSFCPALDKKVKEMAIADFAEAKPILPEPQNLTPAQLRDVLAHAEMFETWLGHVRAFAHAEALRGRIPEGYKMVRGVKHRKWIDEKKVEEVLKDKYGDIIYKSSLKTPAQMEKELGKVALPLLNQLWEKPEGELTLAPESDRRQGVNPVGITFSAVG